MIPGILDRRSPEEGLAAVNVVCFDAKWATPYWENQIRPAPFTAEGSAPVSVTMMHSWEGTYLEDQDPIGFMKRYGGDRYAFASMPPKQEHHLGAWISSLTGVRMWNLVTHAADRMVDTKIPMFVLDYSADVMEPLRSMGIRDLFHPKKAN